MILSSLKLSGLRRIWRDIPSEANAGHPDLQSRVQADENGAIIPIFAVEGGYWVSAPCKDSFFEKLDDAAFFVRAAPHTDGHGLPESPQEYPGPEL